MPSPKTSPVNDIFSSDSLTLSPSFSATHETANEADSDEGHKRQLSTQKKRAATNFYDEINTRLKADPNITAKFADATHKVKDIESYFNDRYENARTVWREIGKYAFAIITLPLLAFGLLRFIGTTRIVKPGELMVKKDFRGNYTVLPPGRHSLFPWEEYVTVQGANGWPTEIQTVMQDRLVLGNMIVQRVKPGELGSVVNRNSAEIQLLEPGTYIFDSNKYNIEQPKAVTVTSTSNNAQQALGNTANSPSTTAQFRFGGVNGIVILNVKGDEVAVRSDQTNGENTVLQQGLHVVSAAENKVYGPVERNKDIVNLGPIQVITARAGYKGIYYRRNNNKEAALHVVQDGTRVVLDISRGDRFHHLINTQVRSEEIKIPHAVTSDGFEYEVKANITYEVENVEKVARKIDNANEDGSQATGDDQIKEEVHAYAKRIISEIILKHSRHDIQPFAADILAGDGVTPPTGHSDKKLKEISKEIQEELRETLSDWGIKLHKDIVITDLKMNDPTQKADFNKQVQEIQKRIFEAEAERQRASGLKVKNANILSVAKTEAEAKLAKAKAESEAIQIKARAAIDGIREALQKAGLNSNEITAYLKSDMLKQILSSTTSAVPVPIGMNEFGLFSKFGKTKGGEVYNVSNANSNASSPQSSTDELARTLAMKATMDMVGQVGEPKPYEEALSEAADQTRVSSDVSIDLASPRAATLSTAEDNGDDLRQSPSNLSL